MKPTSFNYAEYARLQTEMERKNEYVNALITERNQARLECAVAETNHMRTLERFLEAQERITELTAERDALLKHFNEPIKAVERGE